jgi:hypothetical protein
MNSSSKNLVTILLLVTLVFGGYYMYAQNSSELTDLVPVEISADAQIFLERSAALSSITIKNDLFEDPVFRSYKSYTVPPEAEPVGRENPFAEPTDTEGNLE